MGRFLLTLHKLGFSLTSGLPGRRLEGAMRTGTATTPLGIIWPRTLVFSVESSRVMILVKNGRLLDGVPPPPGTLTLIL